MSSSSNNNRESSSNHATSTTQTETQEQTPDGAVGGQSEHTLVLTEQSESPKNKKKVAWTEGTVDNEHLGKKKSKCCCIYVKPKVFIPGEPAGSSSDESDDECKHCPGHHGKDLKGGQPAHDPENNQS